MANREIAYRVADRIEKSGSFDMAQMFHADERPSCIAGHVLDEAYTESGQTTRNHQPTLGDVQALQARLGINFQTAMMLCMPMRPDAHIWGKPGAPDHISKERAAAQLRRVGDGKDPAWELPVIEGKVVERV